MRQLKSKSIDVFLLESAKEEIFSLPVGVKAKLGKLIDELSLLGFLKFPDCRKFISYDLFEIRIKLDGTYRVMFCYRGNSVVILSAFRKKTGKTPMKEIKKALSRKSKL